MIWPPFMKGNAALDATISESRLSEVSPAGLLVGVSGQQVNTGYLSGERAGAQVEKGGV